MSEQSIKAIPTTYNGINFRSRLEAKWAAFFDNIDWPYEYEPIDLDGYIPDFIIKGSRSQVLVEIKPATTLDELKTQCDYARRKTPGKRLVCFGAIIGFTEDWLEHESIIGLDVARLSICEESYARFLIDIYGKGHESQCDWDHKDESTIQAIIGHFNDVELIECQNCKAYYPISEAYYTCIFCGKMRSKENFDTSKNVRSTFDVVKDAWKAAGNTIQYQNSRYFRDMKDRQAAMERLYKK
jgi:hypothetical protein